ncbi:hypothetical protein ABIB24_004249 [Pseudomonas sp. UYEF17]
MVFFCDGVQLCHYSYSGERLLEGRDIQVYLLNFSET